MAHGGTSDEGLSLSLCVISGDSTIRFSAVSYSSLHLALTPCPFSSLTTLRPLPVRPLGWDDDFEVGL